MQISKRRLFFAGFSKPKGGGGFRRTEADEEGQKAAGSDSSVLNCVESEGSDRTSIALPSSQLELYRSILATAKAQNKPLVLVVFSGGCVDLEFARDEPAVAAILWAGFPSIAVRKRSLFSPPFTVPMRNVHFDQDRLGPNTRTIDHKVAFSAGWHRDRRDNFRGALALR